MANFELKGKEILIGYNAGFFANCTYTLKVLSETPDIAGKNIFWAKQERYRNKDQSGNLFPYYFSAKKAKAALEKINVDEHGLYKNIDFSKTNHYIKKYFNLAKEAQKKKKLFEKKYNIKIANTIGLYYRGTDKWLEVQPINIFYYIEEVKKLLSKNKKLRVLVLTDQKQIRDKCIQELGSKAFFIEELPVTDLYKGMHDMPEEERGLDNYNFGVNFLAAIKILSECKYVVCCTGNVGYWVCLFRGHFKGVIQLHPSAFGGEGNAIYSFWPKTSSLVLQKRRPGREFRQPFIDFVKKESAALSGRADRIKGFAGKKIKQISPRIYKSIKKYFPHKE